MVSSVSILPFRYLSKPIKVREFTETLEVALEFAALGRGH
jgi:hypothetical protein